MGTMNLDVFACLIFTAAGPPSSSPAHDGWIPGPLPIVIPRPTSMRSQSGMAKVTDTDARNTHVAERVRDALYGSGRRWHHVVEEAAHGGFTLCAWELLLSPFSDTTLLVAHVQLPSEDPVGALDEISAAPGGEARGWLVSTLPPGLTLAPGPRPRLVTHLRWRGEHLPEPVVDPQFVDALGSWTAIQRWMWFLATGLAPTTMLPDTEDPDMDDGVVHLSHDWRACVLRNGATYIALTPDVADVVTFHDYARVYVRSIHLDSLLLGSLQLAELQKYADRVSGMLDRGLDAAWVEDLETGLMKLRTGLWWIDVANQGRQTSSVLAAFQRQHQLPRLYAEIVSDLTDVARFVQAKQARIQEERDRQSVAQSLRTQHTIALVTFVLFPLTVVYSGAALLNGSALGGGRTLALSTVVGILIGLTGAAVVRLWRPESAASTSSPRPK